MKPQYLIVLLLFGVLLITVLAGCNGSSPSLDPSVSFSFNDDTTLPTMQAGSLLVIHGEVASTGEGNVITGCHWTQQCSETGVAGVFSAPDSAETTWRAPSTWTGDAELPVTLTLIVETALGGRTVQHLNIRVIH